ncbi:C40 family peptidase [Paenibacillus sacheonensis]|uniref:NlpC/P60 family protein n=1 Tax=Paenibacillus sacheonensis TaxID=742054 RepID=A0A7X4YNG6_9BACL|nr:C40 family peptidase [Paenibacillus sacheonensis]MBM7565871.1 cell wall-associated NlpC family hydrolase [Paenibacillus sacheonensis]NBC68811.1 NlpC/P60 family protein [Paenibacillus sacheonensis]
MKNLKKIASKILAVGLCASIGLTALGFGQAQKANAFSSTASTKLINYGDNYLGTPYKFGASTSTTRYFDCSSFTKHVFKKLGYNLPRTARNQAKVGRYVSKSNLKKGDLVFFKVPSRGKFIGHVGIYVGNGKMLNTYGAGGVKISSINSTYWKKNYATARRLGA